MLQFRILFTVVLVLSLAPAPRASQQAATPEPAITGRVLTPDGAPVTQGHVTLMTSPTSRVNAAIDRTGHFRLLPDGQGWKRLFISVPGFAPHRANVNVPSSRTMALPPVTLLDATYFHARFVTADGEPLPGSGLRRRFVDRDGLSIPDPLEHVREHIELDGSVTIGPLPAGQALFAFDRPALAQTRLRDVEVTGTKPVIEGGTITITPGAQLQVEIVDGADKPVPRHEVWIEDAVLPSPLSFQPVNTNEQGRAIFERLAPGRYRVWTRTVERCRTQWLTISRLVAVGSGAAKTRLVLGGRASIRVMSALGPVPGRGVSLSPDARSQAPWQSRILDSFSRSSRRQPMIPMSASSCTGATDGDGRVTLTPFPPGPAQATVRLFNSTYIVRLTIPESGGEMVITVPDGLIPVHVTDQISRQPLAAQVIWVGGGGRVETTATANGDALLEGVGTIGGTLTISAREHQTLEGQFDETPETHQEVALMPSPTASVDVRVVNSDGDAIAGAVVELFSRGPGDAAEFVAANAKGIATFLDLPAGPLQFGAYAEGFASAIVRVAEDARVSIVIALKRAPEHR